MSLKVFQAEAQVLVLHHDLGLTTSRIFETLAARSIEVLAYKNTARIADGLASECDLDLLVSERDLALFEYMLDRLGATQTVPARFHDNAIPSRRDWFLPLEDGKILHLDVANAVMVGRKFCKAYRLSVGPELRKGAIPMVSAVDEA